MTKFYCSAEMNSAIIDASDAESAIDLFTCFDEKPRQVFVWTATDAFGPNAEFIDGKAADDLAELMTPEMALAGEDLEHWTNLGGRVTHIKPRNV